MSTPAAAAAIVRDQTQAIRDYQKALDELGESVRRALRKVIPRDPTVFVTLTVVVRKGTIRVNIDGQSKDPEWRDSSQ